MLIILIIYKARVPVGRIILELPAGMLDDDKGDFVGTAVREVSLSLSLSLSLSVWLYQKGKFLIAFLMALSTSITDILFANPSDIIFLTILFMA